MTIHKSNLSKAVKLLGKDHARFVVRMAEQQEVYERHWKIVFENYINSLNKKNAQELVEKGRINKSSVDFEKLIMQHYLEVTATALKLSKEEIEYLKNHDKKLASYPKIKVPRTFRELQEIYDVWRSKGSLPKRQRDLANSLKKEYIKKCQDVWRKNSKDFLEGEKYDQSMALEILRKGSKGVVSRAKTIVETETTNYFNQTRKDYYDQSNVVTHYLFLAIRDQATTKWCTDKSSGGMRGRHGLVYEKDDPITAKETPACHWNCRSEFVPLSPFNPRHLTLINNKSIHRRNVKCHPLPNGWKAA